MLPVPDITDKMGIVFMGKGVLLPVNTHHLMAFQQEAPGDGLANTLGRARDQYLHVLFPFSI